MPSRSTVVPARVAAVVCLTALLGSTSGDVPIPPGAAPPVGAIEGRVQLQPVPRRRVASQYQTTAAPAHQIQQLPAVAYLVGSVGGAAPARASMEQQDTAFVPSIVFVRPGGSVSFPNEDTFQHDVYSYSRAANFKLERQNPGSSEVRTFDQVGIVEAFCDVHEFMRGAIVVTENPYYAVVADDGSFRIEGVPEGEYSIAFWHPDHEPAQHSVSVLPDRTTTIQVLLER